MTFCHKFRQNLLTKMNCLQICQLHVGLIEKKCSKGNREFKIKTKNSCIQYLYLIYHISYKYNITVEFVMQMNKIVLKKVDLFLQKKVP